VSAPVTSIDEWRRPIVTLTVKSDDTSPLSHKLICHIDTGADPGLVLRSYRKALELGLTVNDRSAFVGNVDTQFEMADGSVVGYLIDFLFVAEWVDGAARWVKVLIPPDQPDRVKAGSDEYQHPDALLGLDLLRSTEFRLNHSQEIVELRPAR